MFRGLFVLRLLSPEATLSRATLSEATLSKFLFKGIINSFKINQECFFEGGRRFFLEVISFWRVVVPLPIIAINLPKNMKLLCRGKPYRFSG